MTLKTQEVEEEVGFKNRPEDFKGEFKLRLLCKAIFTEAL